MRAMLLITALVLVSSPLVAQSSARFTPEDMLEVVTYSPLDLSPDGRWLAANEAKARDRLGANNHRDFDPTFVRFTTGDLVIIDTQTGAQTKPLAGRGRVRFAEWSPDGTRLLVTILRPGAELPEAWVWNRADGRTSTVRMPTTHYVAETGEFHWSADGREVILALRSRAWRERAGQQFRLLTEGPIVRMSSREPFLGWEELARLGRLRSIVAVDVANGSIRDLVPETPIAGQFTIGGGTGSISADRTRLSFAIDTVSRTPYARLSVPGKRETRVIVPPSHPRHAQAQLQARLETEKALEVQWAEDGLRYAYAQDGRVFLGTLDGAVEGEDGRLRTIERQIAGPPQDAAGGDSRPVDNDESNDATRERRARENFALVRFDTGGGWALISNAEGFWEVDAEAGGRQLVVASDTAAGTPLFRFVDMSADGHALFFTSSVRTQWDRGIHRYDRMRRQLTALVRDAHRYSDVRLSKDGSTLVFNRAEGSRPPDLHTIAAAGGEPRRLTHANPRFDDPRLARTELISYLDADGSRQYGVVYYPPDYESGRTYPTILHLYEQFFDDGFEATDKMLNTHGYIVLRPSVPTRADPGYVNESWLKGATAAVNRLIEMGVADSARVGVYGCSYGGFATSLLVTQTNRFKAAIAIAPPTNMVSFYTESPRMGMRNMAFHEAHGDRQLNIAGTLWDAPVRYLQNSAVMAANRVSTPVLILSGGQDHNVPVGQSAELFYALRRLGKDVEWVNYLNAGHCTPWTTEEDFLDYQRRILNWFDEHLRREPRTAAG
jgi:dipeptidyl aminopeptidase/acylaminoacyl peptidase